MIVADITGAGLQPRHWLEALVNLRLQHGLASGPAFSDEETKSVSLKVYEAVVMDTLEAIQLKNPDVIDPKVNIREEYGISRSFRRGATTKAQPQLRAENPINT